MEDCLIVHTKAISKVYIFYGLLFGINIISFVIGTVNYCLSRYNLKYLGEDDPDIDLTGIKSFDFIQDTYNYLNTDYYEGKPNLGNTGKIYIVCYDGKCKYGRDDICTRTECETYEDGDEECWEVDYTCKTTKTISEYGMSQYCRLNDGHCSISSCKGYSDFYRDDCSCSNDKNSKSLKKGQSCTVDNLIFSFENSYYSKLNASYDSTKYSYLKSAITRNETCSEGKKFCGYLDDLGNKLCYDKNENCPMNIITSGETNYTYKTIFGQKLYYTTEPDEAKDNHRVLGGFFVDTDLMINYNEDNGDCQTIITGKISTLLKNHNNKLYRNSLSFDPYKEINIIDNRGQSYLKWCLPGHGKEKNISLIKEINEVYQFNLTANKESIKPIKKRFVASYFTALPGHLGLIASLVYLLLLFNTMNNCGSLINPGRSIFIYLGLFISFILIIIGSILSITNNSQISKSDKKDLGQDIFGTLKKLNITYFSLIIVLIVGIIVFFVYVYITPKTIFETSKPEQSYNLIEQENYKKNDNYINPTNNYNNAQPNYNNNTGYNNDYNNVQPNYNNTGYNNNYNSADFNAYNYNNNPDFNNNPNTNTYANNNNNQGGFYSGEGVY